MGGVKDSEAVGVKNKWLEGVSEMIVVRKALKYP
jgi:hypothetical protein